MSNYSVQYIFRIVDKFSGPLKNFDEQVKKLNITTKQLAQKTSQVGSAMTMRFTLPLVGAIYKLKSFEMAMNQVKAISGATEEQWDTLRKQAINLGKTTKFTSTQVGEAQSFLAMAGFDVDKIYGAIPDTLNLAASANLDMGRSADIVSNVMTGYGLKANELEKAVDVLAKTFTSSNTDLSQLGEAFKYGGPVAKQYGLEIEETTAFLGMLGNAGIQASMAGTTLRGSLVKLMNPSKKAQEIFHKYGIQLQDSSGNMIKMNKLIEEMGKKQVKANEIMEIFDLRAGPGMLAITEQGSKNLEEFTKKLADSAGTASKIAKTQMMGLPGAIVKMTSALDGLIIALGEAGLTGIVIFVADAITSFSSILSDLPGPIKTIIAVLFGFLGAMGPVLFTLGQMGLGFIFLKNIGIGKMFLFIGKTVLWTAAKFLLLNTIKGLTYAWAAAQWVLNTAFLACPLVWIIAAIVAAIGLLVYAIMNWNKIWSWVSEKFANFGVPQWIKDIYDWIIKIVDTILTIPNAISNIAGGISDITGRIGESISGAVSSAGEFVSGLIPESISNFFGGEESKSTIDINLNAPKGAVKSVGMQSSGKGFKPALNIGGAL